MELKKCSRCKEIKLITDFHKTKRLKSGRQVYCKTCVSKILHSYYKNNRAKVLNNTHKYKLFFLSERKKNLKYFVMKMYHLMYDRVKGYTHINYKGKPICTRQEFYNFALNNKQLKILFDNWIKGGYKAGEVPSIDRIENNKGYTLDNIQFLTWYQNTCKQ